MTKKKGGGGGGQFNLPKHLRNSNKGSGGGNKSSSSSSSSFNTTTTIMGSSGSDLFDMNSVAFSHQPIDVLSAMSPQRLFDKVCSIAKQSSHNIAEQGESLYLRLVYIEADDGMKKKCKVLKESYEKLCNLFELESYRELEVDVNIVHENEQLFEDIQNALSAISNQITIYDIRAMLYKLGGLTSVCDISCILMNIVPHIIDKSLNAKCSKFIENSLLALTFILLKITDHTRGREILKQSGMFGTLWNISQFYSQHIDKLLKNEGQNTEWYKIDSVVSETVTGIMYHIGEILNVLTEEHSLEDDLEKLLVTANSKWFPTVGMNEKFGRFTSDIHFAILDLPDLLDWNPNEFNLYITGSNLRLSIDDFDIHAHYPIIKGRTGVKFLHSANVVKWNPQTGLVEDQSDYGPGYYILRGDHHPKNTLSFVKFMQFLYCGNIKKYQSDYEYLNERVSSNLGIHEHQHEFKKKEEEMCDALSSFSIFIHNEESKNSLRHILPHYKNSGLSSSVSQVYACLFDDSDKMLFSFHVIGTYQNYISQNQVDNYKKAYIRSLSCTKKISPINADLKAYFSTHQLVSEQYYDIQLQSNGNIVDEAITADNIHYQKVLTQVKDEGGIPSHRCILACRSEYLRKVLEYESLSHNNSNNMDEFLIQDISTTVLWVINQYMYCGTTVFAKYQIPSEALIECFVVSDLYMLFGLKKFAEEKLCQVLVEWKKIFSNWKEQDVSRSKEMELVEELYELATVHLAVNLKSACYDLLKEYKTKTSE